MMYRAPSFSWASLDTPGLRCAEPSNEGILITVDEVRVTPTPGSDIYGLLDEAYLLLSGKMYAAEVFSKSGGRYGWRFLDSPGSARSIVFLDCVAGDGERVLGPGANLYVVPVRRERGKDEYAPCLLLERVPVDKYRRTGVVMLSPYGDRDALREMEREGSLWKKEARSI
jgi:hypothetical protein